MSKAKVRVFVVDDSSVFLKFLTEGLVKENPIIEVVGYSMNAADAMRKIPALRPDVVTLDIEMPKTNGIEFLKELLPKYLVPVILVSSANVSVFDALANGAVDFVKKPDMSKNYSTKMFISNLASKVVGASNATVKLPHGFGAGAGGAGAGGAGAGAGGAGGAGAGAYPSGQMTSSLGPAGAGQRPGFQAASGQGGRSPVSPASATSSAFSPSSLRLTGNRAKLDNMVIALGASTGGTEATLQVLEQLPADTPGIVITQHMPEGFTAMYAQRLNRLCRMEVKEAMDGDVITRGRILIAPGGNRHMKVVKLGGHYVVNLFVAEKVNGHCPAVDVLFRSVAQTVKENAVGIILTGMGQDGAYGLLEMHKAGAYTIGQNKESCVVYGMPKVAQEIGAVDFQAACDAIPNVLISHLNRI